MRQFAASGSRLWNLSREAKVIYTFFCALSLCAMASSVLLYEDLVGPSLRPGTLTRIRAYYGSGSPGPGPRTPAGADAPVSPAPAGAGAAGAGPEIALPPEAE